MSDKVSTIAKERNPGDVLFICVSFRFSVGSCECTGSDTWVLDLYGYLPKSSGARKGYSYVGVDDDL